MGKLSAPPVIVDADFRHTSRPLRQLDYHHYILRALEAAGARVRLRSWRAALAYGAMNRQGEPPGLLRRLEARDTAPDGRFVRYELRLDHGDAVRVVIDFSDARHLRYPDALDWCHVYYKSNYWPRIDYPERVRPLCNPNGKLRQDQLEELVALRSLPKSDHLCYWSKLWRLGDHGTHSVAMKQNVLEHQIRTFEALAKLGHRADLLAIIPPGFPSNQGQGIGERLRAAGVRVQHGWGDVNTRALWLKLATSRVNFLRTGNHLCISWRMTDLLAMGSCIVAEGAPYPMWHQPLRNGQHYVDGGCTLNPDLELPPDEHYVRLVERIECILEDRPAQRRIRANAAAYFDQHLSPQGLGGFILRDAQRDFEADRNRLAADAVTSKAIRIDL